MTDSYTLAIYHHGQAIPIVSLRHNSFTLQETIDFITEHKGYGGIWFSEDGWKFASEHGWNSDWFLPWNKVRSITRVEQKDD